MTDALDNLAFRFFKLFAQYEFALKALGFHKVRGKNEVNPHWDAFANKIGMLVFENQDDQTQLAIEYLLENPPKRQVITDGVLAWENVLSTDKSSQALFSHIRRVRNNLYHGGKFNNRWFEPDRSYKLISNALVVLDSLRHMHPELNEAISGNID